MKIPGWSKEHEHFPEEDYDDLDTASSADDTEPARAYIQQLLAVAADDARNVVLLATASLATAVILVRDLGDNVAKFKPGWGYVAIAALILLVLAGGLLYWYSAKINYRRMTLARCLASNDARKAREVWADDAHGIHAERGLLLQTGVGCLASGAVAVLLLAGHAL